MSLKSSLLALANNIGMCQENARNIKQVLAGGLAAAGAVTPGDWELVKTETGSTYIDVPEGVSEIIVHMVNNTYEAIFRIPAELLPETEHTMSHGGYGAADDNIIFTLAFSAAKVKVAVFKLNGTTYTSSTSVSLYVR